MVCTRACVRACACMCVRMCACAPLYAVALLLSPAERCSGMSASEYAHLPLTLAVPETPGSWRSRLDLALCCVFAADYVYRITVSPKTRV